MEYNIEDIYIVKNDLKEFISNNKFDNDVYFTDNSRCICKLALDLRYRYDNINQVVDFYRDYMLNGIIDLSYLDYFFKYIKKEYRLNDLICFYNFVFQGCVSKTKVNIINKIVSNYSTNKPESEFLSLIENDFNQFSQLLKNMIL